MEERERPYDEEAVGVFQRYTPAQLITLWKTWEFDKPLIERDSLIEAMKRSGLYPSESILGVYPDTVDPAFVERLLEKKEFSDLRSVPSEEDLCNLNGEFDKTAVQRFIARFLNPTTPYTSCLLYHGVGVGKTCTAITVAETFLDILPEKKVFILAPPSVADNFYKTIFDSRKLVKLPTKERQLLERQWNSPQCTGLDYLTMTDMLLEKDKVKIGKEVGALIKKRYQIMGYGVFANYVKKQILGRVPKHLPEAERIKLEHEELYAAFSDHLFIIDEAHNLRDEGRRSGDEIDSAAAEAAAQGKLVRAVLQQIAPVADGMRLLLMTATPMYNVSTEIIDLLNLLILNDTKDSSALLKKESFFKKKGKDFELIKESESVITAVAKRYVSFMRGENPYSFPLRLTPPTSYGDRVKTEYPTISLSKKEKSITMSNTLKEIMKTLPLIPTVYAPTTIAGRVLQAFMERYHKSSDDIEGEEDDINTKVFTKMAIMSNIIYPDGSSENDGWKRYFMEEEFGEFPKLRRYRWAPRDDTRHIDDIFGSTNILNYSPKMATILRSLKTCKGMGFVFSRSVRGGSIPFAIALERAGWSRVLANGKVEPLLKDPPELAHGRQCALCERHEKGHTGDHAFTPANYILLAGEDKLTPNIGPLVQYATTFPKEDPTAPYGSRVKLILGTNVAAEGLDFKCIREIHLLDPWWHLNRVEQIIGRGVRFCSHSLLPMEERTCSIFLHVATLPSAYETPDLYTYRLAARKSIQIGILQRALKVGAFDCNIHHDVLFISPGKTRSIRDGQGHTIPDYSLADKQYSSFCDFMESCTYTCVPMIDSAKMGTDTSTYKVDDLMRYINAQFNKLKIYYQTSKALYISLKDIKHTFFKDVPWELVALGIRSKINNKSFLVEQVDGTRGTLQLQNGYLVFKPLTITDPEIPIALRHGYAYGRLPTQMKSPFLLSGKKVVPTSGGDHVVAKDIEENAILKLKDWIKEIHALMKLSVVDGSRKAPEGMHESIYRLVQWIPHRFRTFLHIETILTQFYVDRVWTLEERHAVLTKLTEQRAGGTLGAFEDTLLSYFSNPEVFEAEDSGIYGFSTVQRTGEEIRYCKIGANPIGVCSPSVASIIETTLTPPLNGIDGCSPIYGFHVFHKTGALFKILNTYQLSTKNRVFKGSNCTITSNTDRMLEDLATLYKYQKDHPNVLLEPMLLGLRTTKDKADPYTYLNQLKAPELCIYTEILLRAFQACETGSQRWILSMVDARRATETKLIKNKPVQKRIFENSFSF